MKKLPRIPEVILSPYRDYKISRWMKVTLLMIWCFWLAMALFSNGAIYHLVLAAMIALLGLDLCITHRGPNTAVTVCIFALLAVLNVHLLISGQIGYFSLFPLLLFSTAVIFILGIRTSLVFNTVLLVVLLYFLCGPGLARVAPLYGAHLLTRFPYLYVCLVGIAYIIMFSIQNYWVEKAQEHEVLARRIREEKQKLSDISFKVITAMYAALSAKVPGIDKHCENTAVLSRHLAEKLGLDARTCTDAYSAGLLHEVGAVGLPDEVLNATTLTEAQFAVYKTHVTRGEKILRELQIADDLADAVLYHRENYDGTGYPAGLAGKAIPQLSRIVAVADYVDRHRRRGESEEKIRRQLSDQSGTRFDPACVQAMLEIM